MQVDLYEEYDESSGGRARKAKHQKHNISISTSSSSSFNSSSSPPKFFYKGSPKPFIVKIIKNKDKATGQTNRNVGYSMMKALDYLSRDTDLFDENEIKEHLHEDSEFDLDTPIDQISKKLILETDDGRFLSTKKERYDYYQEWSETFTTRKDGKDYEHVLLSTLEKPGQNEKEVLAAARNTLQEQFGSKGYNYTFVLHKDTDNLHIHAIIRVHNTLSKERLDIRKDDIWNTKVVFAKELRNQGLNYEASIQFDRIKGLDNQLEYMESVDLTWFRSNMAKFEGQSVDQLLNKVKQLDVDIKKSIDQKQNTNLNKVQKDELSKNISEYYGQKKAIIYTLNGLEYDLKQAIKNYNNLVENQNKIPWHLKGSKRYKEISEKINEAKQDIATKKIDLDKAQKYLNDTKSNDFSLDPRKSTLDYVKENIKNTDNINTILSQINYLESKQPNSKITKDLKQLKQELESEDYIKYRDLGKKFLLDDLDLIHDHNRSKNIKDKISKNYDVFEYELKGLGLDTSNYSFKNKAHVNNAILLDQNTKEILNKHLSSLEPDLKFNKFVQIQVNKESIIYEYQLKKLNIDSNELLKELNTTFTPVTDYKKVVDFEKTYIDRFNDGTISSIKYKNIDYINELESIKDIDYTKLDLDRNIDDFVKLDNIREQAILNKDLEALDITYRNEKAFNHSTTIKEYGTVLNIDLKDINKELWIKTGYDVDMYDGFGDSVVKDVDNYKEEFTKLYLEKLETEYIVERLNDKALSTEEEYEIAQRDIDRFNDLVNAFKEELEYNKKIETIKDHIENERFKDAKTLINDFEFKDEFDKQSINELYELSFDFSTNDKLEQIKERIDALNELEYKAYAVDPDEILKNVHENEINKVEDNKILTNDNTNTSEPDTNTYEFKKRENAINHNEVKKAFDNKVKEFKTKTLVALDQAIEKNHSKEYQDKVFTTSKILASELKRNMMQIESTKEVLNTLNKNDKVEKDILEQNYKEYSSKAKDINDTLAKYLSEVEKSSLAKSIKNDTKINLYDELNKHKYNEKIVSHIPELKDKMIDRSIEHFKAMNEKLKEPSITKEKQTDIVDRSSDLLKDFNKLNPSWKQERTITKLHKEQVKTINQMQRGMSR